MQIVKTEYDPIDADIILTEDLVNVQGDFYNLTFEQALNEETRGKPLLYCEYMIQNTKSAEARKLCSFLGWTEDRVIFNVVGIGTPDTLLDSVPRNPPDGINTGRLLQDPQGKRS